MLFQNTLGKLVEINRMDYVNDAEYYIAILRIKGVSLPKTVENPDNRILQAFTSNISKQNHKLNR